MTYTRVHRSASPPNSPSPVRGRSSRSLSRSRRSRSRSREPVDVKNPGNNLFVTGLSTRVTADDLEKYFSKEGKVVECHLVTDPRSKESRGFAFVTMDTVEEAEHCIKYLHRSVLEGRLISVEKAKRKRGRTPTPGRYQGLKDRRGRRRSRSYSPCYRYDRDYYPRDRRGRSRSLSCSRSRSRDYYSRDRRGRSRSRSRSLSRSRSPYGKRGDGRNEQRRRSRERSLSAGRDGRSRRS